MTTRRLPVLTGAILAVMACGALAQTPAHVMDDFRQAHPRVRFYDEGGRVSAIYGKTFSTGDSPLASAQNFLRDYSGMFGQEIGQLAPETDENGNPDVVGVMYNRETGQYKLYTFRFEQAFGGIPVFRSGIGFLVRNEDGFPLVNAGFSIKELRGFDLPEAGEPRARITAAMMANVREALGVDGVQTTEPELVIWAGTPDVHAEPRLAVTLIAQHGSNQTWPDYQKEFFVADLATGEILLQETMIHHCMTCQSVDIVGSVSGRATDGVGAWTCHPEIPMRLPYGEVAVDGGNTAFADENGDFVIPHAGGSPVTVRSWLRGPWFVVHDLQAGGQTPVISMQVTPPGPADFLHNPLNNQQFPTANVNCYLHANIIRDWTLFFAPEFPQIHNQQGFRVNTNRSSTCNAFYDGAINFYWAGDGCDNTGFSDVVYHEYGHHLIAVSDNGQGQMGEGTGDTVGVILQDEPILAHGFQNCNSGIRTADNNLQYPCSGGSHFCGQLLSGCIWDTRNELVVTEPDNYSEILADLFINMLVVRGKSQGENHSTINPFITILFLELDDDDGDISNGTPHYNEIAAGFGAHNMDAPPLDLLDFEYPSGRPELIAPSGGVAFTVEVTPVVGTPEPGTGLLHVDDGGGFVAFPMNEIADNFYEAIFPAIPCGTEVRYFISAETDTGVEQFDPETAPDVVYTAYSATNVDLAFEDDFETDQGWSVSGNAADGH